MNVELELPIEKYLTISTANLSFPTTVNLEKGELAEIVTYQKLEFGWIVYDCPDDDPAIPAEIVTAVALAKAAGCYGVIYDQDADVCELLPRFEW